MNEKSNKEEWARNAVHIKISHFLFRKFIMNLKVRTGWDLLLYKHLIENNIMWIDGKNCKQKVTNRLTDNSRHHSSVCNKQCWETFFFIILYRLHCTRWTQLKWAFNRYFPFGLIIFYFFLTANLCHISKEILLFFFKSFLCFCYCHSYY